MQVHTEEQRMTGSPWMLSLATLTLTGALTACGGKEHPPAGRDTTSAMSPDSAAPAAAGPTKVEGFDHPESVKYDAELDVWYVANINGSPFDKDGNGYISRLKGDGSVDSLKFIVSGVNGVKLDGPKGMALQGDTIWVADITNVRGLNRRTGQPVASIALKGAKFLNDVTVAEDGIYVTDTGTEAAKNGMNHTGPDRVYRIGPKHEVSVAVQNDSLAGPNGITWDGAGRRFIVVPFMGKSIVTWTPGAKQVTALGTTKGQLDGVEMLEGGRVLFTSWADSTLDVLDHGTVTTVSTGLPSPADIGVDTKRGRVAIPLLLENRIEFRQLPPEKGAGPS
jgi:SMP-30/gluconolaconase/LRE-like protein